MFQWHAGSRICYVWLSDLAPDQKIEDLYRCRWWTRGWTLQELLAPKVVEFYDRDWALRGTKSKLRNEIHGFTGIDKIILQSGPVGVILELLLKIPVARRMSWAANRVTTRLEDEAYCLLGIFNVNMPLLYGEGEKAFIRLQEEIIKETNDLTLFAWKKGSTVRPMPKTHGILATSPADFKEAGDILTGDDLKFGNEFTMTNKGLRILPNISVKDGKKVLALNCYHRNSRDHVGIYITQHGSNLYVRDRPDILPVSQTWTTIVSVGIQHHKEIFISKYEIPSIFSKFRKPHRYAFRLGDSLFGGGIWTLSVVQPEDLYDGLRKLFITHGSMRSFSGSATFNSTTSPLERKNCALWFGMHKNRPWVSILRTEQERHISGEHGFDRERIATFLRSNFGHEVVLSVERNPNPTEILKFDLKFEVSLDEREVEGEPVYCLEAKISDCIEIEISV
ncbi:hypothetical protein IFR05_016285 [Cadophora sp. M221]|nr:hypothetical protein IFR05_016285 [Cadophora sp. M221]